MTDQEQCYFMGQVGELAKAYRARCLWFAREDFMPRTLDAAQRVLSAIEKYGDRTGFEAVQRLRQWLLLHSNAMSAGS